MHFGEGGWGGEGSALDEEDEVGSEVGGGLYESGEWVLGDEGAGGRGVDGVSAEIHEIGWDRD